MSTTISGTNGVTFPDSTSMQTGQQACKAWVNFNGTGTVAIRSSYNVSSIADNGAGDYTVNFTAAMSDANYAVTGSAEFTPTVTALSVLTVRTYNASNIRIDTSNSASGAKTDPTFVNVAIFR